jgi:hypothetical protein
MAVKRALSPATNATGLGSAAAALYAAVVMIWNATHHQGVIDPQVIVAALAAGAFLYSRMKVTPIADPKDGNGVPLTVAPAPMITMPSNATLTPEDAAALRARLEKTLHQPSVPAQETPAVPPAGAGM